MLKKITATILGLHLLLICGFGLVHVAQSAPPVETNKPKSELFLIYLGADWCLPCKRLAKTMEDVDVQREIEKFDHSDRNGKPFPHYVDTDKQPHIARIYGVQAIPMLLIVEIDDEKVRVVKRLAGEADKATLLKFLAAGKNSIDTSVQETIIVPPVWTLKGVILILFKVIKALLG